MLPTFAYIYQIPSLTLFPKDASLLICQLILVELQIYQHKVIRIYECFRAPKSVCRPHLKVVKNVIKEFFSKLKNDEDMTSTSQIAKSLNLFFKKNTKPHETPYLNIGLVLRIKTITLREQSV